MKKLAFIIRLLQKDKFHGGGEKLFFNLIKSFCEENNQIDIYCSKSDIENIEGINKIIVVDEYYDHLKPQTMEKFYAKVKELIKNENYDAVISENITPPVDITFLQGHSLLNRLKRDKNPLETFFYNFRKVKKERMKFHKKWLDEGYRKIFVVSNVLKRDIIENYNISENKISVIYPGVDISDTLIVADSHAPNIAYGDLIAENNNKTITFGIVAPGFKIKGGFIFLKALGLIKKKGYDFKAKIIYPKYRKNLGVKLLIKLLNIEKNIEFLPYQENIQEFYRSIDCLVAPSIEDTFNLAVLEAMINYRPCIVSTNAGASEIIEDGKNGFVFEIKNNPEKNLAEKMILFIESTDKNKNICSNAFETAKYYSWQRTFENFVSELGQI
jgi:UDP-glucose:(heptosyl)LPS alpha-1,3-glucosyltransferase